MLDEFCLGVGGYKLHDWRRFGTLVIFFFS